MDTYAFMALLRRAQESGVREQIESVITEHPGIVAETWSCNWTTLGGFPDNKELWTWCFRLAGYTDGAGRLGNNNPAEPPEGPILLVRGCPPERRRGMSWTRNLGLARHYARENLSGAGYNGHVYCHWAWGVEMLAHIHESYRRKRLPGDKLTFCEHRDSTVDEYILDPRYLNDQNVKPYEVSAGEYAEMYARYTMAGYTPNFGIKADARI